MCQEIQQFSFIFGWDLFDVVYIELKVNAVNSILLGKTSVKKRNIES